MHVARRGQAVLPRFWAVSTQKTTNRQVHKCRNSPKKLWQPRPVAIVICQKCNRAENAMAKKQLAVNKRMLWYLMKITSFMGS